MSDKSFADGFRAGWRSILGPLASVPPAPPLSSLADRLPYEHGFGVGVDAARRHAGIKPESGSCRPSN